jgi:hypothetical protein
MSCISLDQLFELTQNTLSADEIKRIEAHLSSGCNSCRCKLAQLRKLLAAIASRDLLRPPDWLVEQARNLYSWHVSSSGRSDLKRTPAILLIDSFSGGLLTDVRGVGLASRQMLYRAGEYDIDLSIDHVEQAHTMDIIGQVMPLVTDMSASAAAGVDLFEEPGRTFSTEANEFGEFIFSGIPEGIYQLRIALKDEELDICKLNTALRPD